MVCFFELYEKLLSRGLEQPPLIFEITPITSADIPVLALLNLETSQDTYSHLLSPSQLKRKTLAAFRRDWKAMLAIAGYEITAARRDDQIVAACAMGPSANQDLQGAIAHEIYPIHVLPAFQRNGIGEQLLDRLTGSSLNLLRPLVIAGNPIGEHFFSKAGFEPEPKTQKAFVIYGAELEVIRYRRLPKFNE